VYEDLSISLQLAGRSFSVTVQGPCVHAHVTARFGAFYASATPPEAWLTVRVLEAWAPSRTPRVAWPGADGMQEPDGTIRFVRETDEVLWHPQTRRGEALRAHIEQPHAGPVVDATPIDTPLRLILSFDLPQCDGLLVHASGYGDDRGAVVFLAPSRGGKTTTARKLTPAQVLSDDQVALRRQGGTWYAHALPFVGEYARATTPRVSPLRALVLLDKATTLSLERVATPRALARVLGCVVRFVRGGGAEPIIDLASDLVARVPVYHLALSRDEPVIPVVERLLA
jgi:hypothetical protein